VRTIKAYVEFIHVERLYDRTVNASHGHFEEREVPSKQNCAWFSGG
jgi:hypothetical protein